MERGCQGDESEERKNDSVHGSRLWLRELILQLEDRTYGFCRDQRAATAAERLLDHLLRLGVVENRAARQVDWLVAVDRHHFQRARRRTVLTRKMGSSVSGLPRIELENQPKQIAETIPNWWHAR